MNPFQNRWLWILSPPAVLFGALMWFGVPPDTLLWLFSIALFIIVAYPAAKYFWRTTEIVWNNYAERQDFNVAGWAFVLLGLMTTQIYRWVWLSFDRPDWLTGHYWSAAYLYLMLFGFGLVAWSARKAPPDAVPSEGGFGFIHLFVGFISGVGLMLSGALPAAIKGAVWWAQGFLRIAFG